jgi:peptide deformylase
MEAERYKLLLLKQRDVMRALREHVARLQDELRQREAEREQEAAEQDEAEHEALRATMVRAGREVRRLREAVAQRDALLRVREEELHRANRLREALGGQKEQAIALQERETAMRKREADVETAVAMKEAQWHSERLSLERQVRKAALVGERSEQEVQRLRQIVAQREHELAEKQATEPPPAAATSLKMPRRGCCGFFVSGSSPKMVQFFRRPTLLALLAGLALVLALPRSAYAHGAFEGSIVRTAGDSVLHTPSKRVRASDLRCRDDDNADEDSVEDDDDDDNGNDDSSDLDWLLDTGCGALAETWVRRMLRGMSETSGAAIAAPQVGLAKRIVVISIPEERISEEKEPNQAAKSLGAAKTTLVPPIVLVNPKIHPLLDAKSNAKIEAWESCLSVPGERVAVWRYPAVHWRAQRLDGMWVEGTAVGRLALLLQHELDHLDGRLMTDVGQTHATGALLRADGLGPVTSNQHLEVGEMWDIRTAILPGGRLMDGKQTYPTFCNGSAPIPNVILPWEWFPSVFRSPCFPPPTKEEVAEANARAYEEMYSLYSTVVMVVPLISFACMYLFRTVYQKHATGAPIRGSVMLAKDEDNKRRLSSRSRGGRWARQRGRRKMK